MIASFVISWNTIRRTGTFGFRTSTRCQAIASPSRSSSVASRSSSASASRFFKLGDDLLLLGIDDVIRLEVLLHVDAKRAEPLALGLGHVLGTIREIPHMADAGTHGVVVAEVPGDRPRLGGGLDDDEALGHRRDTIAPDSAGAGPRYCNA